VDADDVRVVEAGEDLALSPEAGDDAVARAPGQPLQGDGAVGGPELAGQVHLAAGAGGDQPAQLVAGQRARTLPDARSLASQAVEECGSHNMTISMLSTLVYA